MSAGRAASRRTDSWNRATGLPGSQVAGEPTWVEMWGSTMSPEMRNADGVAGRAGLDAGACAAGVRAVQADVVGSVALAEDHPPGVAAHRDRVALGERR